MTTNYKQQQGKKNRLIRFHQNESFGVMKDTNQKVKRQTTEWENFYKSCIDLGALYSKYTKNCYNSIKR
jgi:hypothetical protein